MTCKECRKAKPFAPGSMYCLLYGIIIREDHEGNLKGCEDDAGEDAGDIGEIRAETEYPDDEWDAVDGMQGVFPE